MQYSMLGDKARYRKYNNSQYYALKKKFTCYERVHYEVKLLLICSIIKIPKEYGEGNTTVVVRT